MQEQLNQANIAIDRQANAPTVDQAIYGTPATTSVVADDINNTIGSDNNSVNKTKRF